MVRIIDARNLSCPKPVMLTNRALSEVDEVITIVSDTTAQDNVSRLGKNEGCEVTVEHKDDGIYLTLKKARSKTSESQSIAATATVLFITSDILGSDEYQELGSYLIKTFLDTVGGLTSRPETMIFMNSGVKLVTNDSPVLEELQQLENLGVNILACGRCLTSLQLTEQLAVGQISNMFAIVEIIFQADKVVSL